ncbi:response regulator [Paenibacillus psychroresistens]|uniref:Response regulator n=1 Tax=Paenibacillus psychroresistens TaxID=1778678 RepID=A0A6B8RDJ4_9BACL|nr:response regulator [Paenibacillus psychroresistens]QGQ93987.1 response regulator [Paenibacillus psychroresistens]
MYKVMIIDDEPWSRKVIKQLGDWDKLQLSVIEEAEDGSEGLRLIQELAPDIVVTDMRMPGIDGVELLKALNERHPELKIIVMSGYDDFVYLKQAIRSQAKEYLLKPVDPDELNAALAQCVRELQQAKQISAVSWSTPLIFADTASLNQYLEYRQLIYGYLLDLNADGVGDTLDTLHHFLEGIDAEHFVGSMLNKIGHDFTLMLEEFVATSELEWSQMIPDLELTRSESSDQNSVSETILQIGYMYNQVIAALQGARKNRNKLDMREVLAYISRHYNEAITLESIASYFYISKEHLSRAFKTFNGDNMTDFITHKRMEKAKELIVERKLSIKHAAEMTGYADIAYFYKVFKKHYGFAPGELRKGTE